VTGQRPQAQKGAGRERPSGTPGTADDGAVAGLHDHAEVPYRQGSLADDRSGRPRGVLRTPFSVLRAPSPRERGPDIPWDYAQGGPQPASRECPSAPLTCSGVRVSDAAHREGAQVQRGHGGRGAEEHSPVAAAVSHRVRSADCRRCGRHSCATRTCCTAGAQPKPKAKVKKKSES
jgi:hypothetical protein